MGEEEAKELIRKFKERKCYGIASFLEFMLELRPEKREQIFSGVHESMFITDFVIDDPFEFFDKLYQSRARYGLFVDETMQTIDATLGEVAKWWFENKSQYS